MFICSCFPYFAFPPSYFSCLVAGFFFYQQVTFAHRSGPVGPPHPSRAVLMGKSLFFLLVALSSAQQLTTRWGGFSLDVTNVPASAFCWLFYEPFARAVFASIVSPLLKSPPPIAHGLSYVRPALLPQCCPESFSSYSRACSRHASTMLKKMRVDCTVPRMY